MVSMQNTVPPVLSYLFHRLDQRFTGDPTLLMLDESWLFLSHPIFSNKIRDWLKTLRKANVAVVFSTQSVADMVKSPIFSTLNESCPTRIFLPNRKAFEPEAYEQYQRFGLNHRQIEILVNAMPKRQYYCQSDAGNRLFDLGLDPVSLAICASSSKEDHRLMDALLEEGKEDLLNRWLELKTGTKEGLQCASSSFIRSFVIITVLTVSITAVSYSYDTVYDPWNFVESYYEVYQAVRAEPEALRSAA